MLEESGDILPPETNFSQIDSGLKDRTLSVIIRCHKEEGLSFLDEALFSLAIQYWQELEVIIVLQNGTEKFKYGVTKLIEKQPFHKDCKFQVHIVEIPLGQDGRSILLNYGIKRATGRYLAFLDYDDVVYQHGYKTLIDQLTDSGASIAAGGCRTADVKIDFGNWYIRTKKTPYAWGKTRYDLFRDNFLPIHSYVIDRLRIKESDLYFDENLSLLEDYDFLLRLNAKYDFDFSKMGVFVCEYRIHDTGSMPNSSNASPELLERYATAFQLIKDRKSAIQCAIPVSDLLDLLAAESIPTVNSSTDTIDISNDDLTESENIAEMETQSELQNPQTIRKVLNSTGDKIYNFFSRHPRVEKQISKSVHFGWRILKKGSHNSNNS